MDPFTNCFIDPQRCWRSLVSMGTAAWMGGMSVCDGHIPTPGNSMETPLVLHWNPTETPLKSHWNPIETPLKPTEAPQRPTGPSRPLGWVLPWVKEAQDGKMVPAGAAHGAMEHPPTLGMIPAESTSSVGNAQQWVFLLEASQCVQWTFPDAAVIGCIYTIWRWGWVGTSKGSAGWTCTGGTDQCGDTES